MPRDAIEQASCTECGENEDNFTVTNTELDRDDDGSPFVEHDTRCECGETGTVTIDEDGTSASENISYDEASWNQSDEEDDSDE